ncbi:MAG: Two-component hybrid sensor and regulator [Myxococcales bacterium]|nr:Two-component hybrid sensor and regulator [Myxococcales bacterium]
MHTDTASGRHGHSVQFYETDNFLCDQVAAFLAAGLAAGDGVVVIASEPHRTALIERLAERGFDVDVFVRNEQFALLDAQDILRTFMAGSAPDPDRFMTVLGPVIELVRDRSPSKRVRAYGEMVDVLWQAGNIAAASRLEDLWGELAESRNFALLCAYTMAGFYKEPSAEAFADVCKHHDGVGPFELAEGTAKGPAFEQVQALSAEIARRQAVEAELRDANRALQEARELEHARLQETARGAEAAQRRIVDELTSTLRLNELFTGVLAHDLRNPLAAMIMAAQVLMTRANPADTKTLQRILSSGERMARMIDQLLDFTRIRVGPGIPYDPKPCNLGAVIEHVVAELSEKRIHFEAEGDLAGSWDADRLSQAFSNLLGNALQHGDGGDVVVRAEGTDPETIRISIHNGGQIPEERLPKLFEPLGGGGHKEGSRGLGLGLFITREIAKVHGGNVEVVSSDAGTTFTVSLPRIAAPREAGASAEDRAKPPIAELIDQKRLDESRRLEQESAQLAQAQRGIRLRDELLSMLSHELKTPLTSLQLQLQSLLERVESIDPRAADMVSRSIRSGDRLASLIECLLDDARIATGHFSLALEQFDFASAVAEAVERFREQATRVGCQLVTNLEGPIIGSWDRARMMQVISNLLSNAIKYGNGAPIEVSLARAGSDVVLRIRDHGPGIATEDTDRIFERFERAASVRHYGGLGLGLYVIREITHAHGGSITSENASGGGACFTLRIPLGN